MPVHNCAKMERIFSGAWKDKRGKTQTNDDESEQVKKDDDDESEEVLLFAFKALIV